MTASAASLAWVRRRWGTVFFVLAAFLLARLALAPQFAAHTPLPLLILVVLAASRWRGLIAGLVATAVCAPFLAYFPAPPVAPGGSSTVIDIAIFCVTGIAVSRMAGQLSDAFGLAASVERRYRTISETLRHLIWMSTPDGCGIHFNAGFAKYTGLDPNVPPGEGWPRLMHPDDASRVQQSWRNALASAAPFRLEFRLKRHDGAWRWFEGRGVPLKDERGAITGWIVSNTDTQDATELREALRAESARFQKIVETVPGAVCLFLPDPASGATVSYASPRVSEVFGFSPEELKRNSGLVSDRIHPDDQAAIGAFLHSGAKLSPWLGDFRYDHPVRGERWLECRMTPEQTAGQICCYAVLTDITARKQSELAAREWQRAFEQADLAIALHNPEDNTLRAVNASYARQRGYTPEELRGRPIAAVAALPEIDKLPAFFAAADRRDTHFVYESLSRRKDGSVFPVWSDVTSIRDESGTVVSRVALVQDLTERKRIESELQRSESLYRTIAANIPGTAVFVLDHDLRIQAAEGDLNPSLKVRPHDLEGQSIESLFDGELLERETGRCRRALAGESGSAELALGGRIIVTHWVPLKDAAGKVVAALQLVRDVTAQREATAALRQAEAELLEAQRIARIGSWRWDARTKAVTGSHEFFRIHNWVPALPMPDYSAQTGLFDPDVWARIRAATHSALETGAPWEIDAEMTHADGLKRWVTIRCEAVRDEAGKITGLRGTRQDTTERKRVEDALRESEEQFRTLANAIPQLCSVAEADGSLSWFNQRWYEYTGIPPGTVALFRWRAVCGRHALPLVIKRWRYSLETGVPFEMELRLRAADGSFRPFLIRFMPVRSRDGEVVRWFGTATDISEQHETVEALERTAEQRRLALEAADLGAWNYHFLDREVEWDERCRSLFGVTGGNKFSWSEFLGRVAAEDRETMDHSVQAALAGANGGIYNLEFRVIWLDGSVHWLSSHGRVYFQGEDAGRRPIRFIGVVRDITERRHTEQALREAEQELMNAQHIAHVGSWYWDLKTDAFRASPELYNVRGWDLHKPVPPVSKLEGSHTPESWVRAGVARKRIVETGEPYEVELEIFRDDGTPVWVAVRAEAVLAPDGSVVAVRGTQQDITERKRTEQEIRDLNSGLELRVKERTTELEAANRELEAFAYAVSHDLRAPLRGIDGWSLALQEDYGHILDETGLKYLGRVRGEAQRMATLIDELLQLSRVTRSEIRRLPVDLSVLARDIAQRLQEAHPERQLEFSIAPDLRAKGDSRLIEVALTNLLDNAVKFTDREPVARIEIGLAERGGETVFFVRDNGVGFDMAHASSLFGAFQRLHRASEFPGTGIGLATVQRIVRRHGGHISVDASPGRGAAFYFTFGAS